MSGTINQKVSEWISTLDEIKDYLQQSVPASSERTIEMVLEREEKPEPEPVVEAQNVDEFTVLKELVNSPRWPLAVPADLICDTANEDDKIERAEGVLDLLVPSLKDKKFLDFGCGEGHTAVQATKRLPTVAVGYDLKPDGGLWDANKEVLTTDFDVVKAKGPYDVILLYDVLDHLVGEPKVVFEQLASVIAPGGKVYLRCHPWCSRHGSHLYHQINKAFVHVVFSEDELVKLGYQASSIEPTQKVIFPVKAYKEMVGDTFKVDNVSQSRNPVEQFFQNNEVVKNRIMAHWKTSKFPVFQMEQSFVDIILSK